MLFKSSANFTDYLLLQTTCYYRLLVVTGYLCAQNLQSHLTQRPFIFYLPPGLSLFTTFALSLKCCKNYDVLRRGGGGGRIFLISWLEFLTRRCLSIIFYHIFDGGTGWLWKCLSIASQRSAFKVLFHLNHFFDRGIVWLLECLSISSRRSASFKADMGRW